MTSEPMSRLEQEKSMLLSRLVEPKKSERKPYKPIQKCARTASLAKIDQIAEHFLGKDRALPTLEEFEKTTSMLRSRLGVASADKVVNEKRKLSVMDDINVFSGIVSASKRREIKSRLVHKGLDILAPTSAVDKQLKQFTEKLQISSINKNGIWYLYLSNIKAILEYRLLCLHQSGKLLFGSDFNNKVFLVFVGDKGGRSTKSAIGIGNVTHANSPDSLLLVSIFDDNDNYENLASLQPVFEQIKFSNIKVGEQELEVEWFLTGDLKFIDTVYGHLGSSATHPCPICESPKTAFKENSKHSKRTLFSLDQGQLRFRYNTQDAQTLTQKQQTNLHRECHSVTRSQLLQIPITNIIPPSLHLIQGLCQAIIEAIEAAEPSMVNQLEAVFVELQVDKRVWHQRFTGNHVRKLLTGEGPQKIISVIRENVLHKAFLTLLTLLGKMQSLAKNSFLSDGEIENFHGWSAEYFHTIRNAFPNWAITPKCHILCQHVIEFMKLHRFWGLLSEQSIEALHCKVNGDERRLCGIRERKKTLKKIMEDSFVRNILFDGKKHFI